MTFKKVHSNNEQGIFYIDLKEGMNELTSGYCTDFSFYLLISPILKSQYNTILKSKMGVIYGVTSFNFHQSF